MVFTFGRDGIRGPGALSLFPGISCVPRYPGSHWIHWPRIWLSTPVIVRPRPFAAQCGLARCSTCRPCGSTMSSSPTPALLVRSCPVPWWLAQWGIWEMGQGDCRLEGGLPAQVSFSLQ